MHQPLLDEIEAERATYGGQRQSPCSDDRLERLRRRVPDRVPGNLIETHPSFDQLLAAALRAHL